MSFLDRWRTRRNWSDADIRAFLEAMQPINALSDKPPPKLIAELSAACSAYPELQAAYLFASTFGDGGEPLLIVGLVLTDPSDPEPFVTISNSLEPRLEPLVLGDDYMFQLLDEYSLARVTGRVSPIFERG